MFLFVLFGLINSILFGCANAHEVQTWYFLSSSILSTHMIQKNLQGVKMFCRNKKKFHLSLENQTGLKNT